MEGLVYCVVSILNGLKRMLVGRKLASTQLGETLLPKRIALPVFASDALSSVAYAPDEILIMLSLAGMAGYAFSWQIGLAVAVVMTIVVLSYRQAVYAYPNGGGDYEVARVNLGPNASLTVASALLVDYVLTVAVSVSSGVQNAAAMIPWFNGREVWVASVVILLLMTMNLRGIRESGSFFAIPTYGFMVAIIGMVAYGLFRIFILGQPLMSETADLKVIGQHGPDAMVGLAMVALLARAFSSGCAALTGVEAIANGVPAFQKPKSKNAATVLSLLGLIAISMLLGIIALANITKVHLIDEEMGVHYENAAGEIIHQAGETVVGQLARVVFMDTFQPGFYIVITATMIILFLAANTAFNGFPVLGSILARDDYLPRQLHTRGDRLAFSNGILMLSVAAIALVVAFNASVTSLIQLYVVGVFVSFTIGQYGLMKHWTRHLATETDAKVRAKMQRSRAINAVGCLMTFIVLIIVLISKVTHGAYLAIIAMGVVFFVMKMIRRHYNLVDEELVPDGDADQVLPSRVRAMVLVTKLNKPTLRALSYAKAARPTELLAVTVSVDEDETAELLVEWEKADMGVPLQVVASPYREITNPFLKVVNQLRSENPRDVVAVYIPDYVVGHWWEQLLHNQTALMIRSRLHFMKGVMVISVPYQLASSEAAKKRAKSLSQSQGPNWPGAER